MTKDHASPPRHERLTRLAINGSLIALLVAAAILAVWPHSEDPPSLPPDEPPRDRLEQTPPPAVEVEAPPIAPGGAPPLAQRDPSPTRAAAASLAYGQVRDTDGRPIAGATVAVTLDANAPDQATRAPFATAVTDARGRYRLEDAKATVAAALRTMGASGLELVALAPRRSRTTRGFRPGRRCDFTLGPAGTLEIVARRRGSGDPVPGVNVLLYSALAEWTQRRRVNLGPTGRIRLDDVVPGEYLIRPTPTQRAVRQARVFVEPDGPTVATLEWPAAERIRVRGVVVDADTDATLSGVALAVRDSAPTLHRAVTDGAGQFTFASVDRDHQLFPDGVFQRIGDAVYTGHESERRSDDADGERRYTLRLKRAVVITVCGTINDPAGSPMAGVRVRPAARGSFEAVTTDSRGHFTVVSRHPPSAEPSEGRIHLVAEAAGYAPTVYDQTVSLDRQDATHYTTRPIRIDLTVGGGLKATLRAPDGKPLADAHVRLLARRRHGPGIDINVRGLRGKAVDEGSTSAEGIVGFANIVPGAHAVLVSADGYPRQVLEVGQVPDAATIVVDLTMEPAQLSGTVVDQTGRPLPETYVAARSERTECASTRTDWDGRFHLLGLPDGPVTVTATRTGYDAVAVEVTDRSVPPRIVLPPATAVHGTVLVATTGEPAAGCRISLRQPGRSRCGTVARPDGGFRVSKPHGLRPGAYQVEATLERANRVWRGTAAVTVVAGQQARLDLTVSPTLAVDGRVVAPDGTAAPNATVELFPASDLQGDPIAETNTDKNGGWSIRELDAGRYVIRVRHPRWVEVSRAETIHGARRVVDFVLERNGATVQVVVVDEDGRPVAGATVELYRASGAYLAPDRYKYENAYFAAKRSNPNLTYASAMRMHQVTDTTGRLTRRFLPAGDFRIVVKHEGCRGEAMVRLPARGAVPVRVVLQRATNPSK